MKSTGITRNIDEVGRLVIPREIRKALKLEQGSPMEIYIDNNQELILKKISPVFDLSAEAQKICKITNNVFEINIIITDLETIIAYSGEKKSLFINKSLNEKFIKLIKDRTKKYFGKNENIEIIDNEKCNNFVMSPIVIDSNCCGSIIIFNSQKNPINEKILLKLADFACNFLFL